MKAGFTLIELFVAMLILISLLGLIAMLYQESDAAWEIGLARGERNMGGRPALDMMIDDLRQAAADPWLSFSLEDGGSSTYGTANSRLCFVSLRGDATDGMRAARGICYWVRETTNTAGVPQGRFELVRGCHDLDPSLGTNDPAHCYWNPDWHRHAVFARQGVLAENVAGLRFLAPAGGTLTDLYESTSDGDRLPPYLDIYLELLDERSARRAARMTNAAYFVERHIERHTARVAFPNRNGYRQR